jgi:hypothetical protein
VWIKGRLRERDKKISMIDNSKYKSYVRSMNHLIKGNVIKHQYGFIYNQMNRLIEKMKSFEPIKTEKIDSRTNFIRSSIVELRPNHSVRSDGNDGTCEYQRFY